MDRSRFRDTVVGTGWSILDRLARRSRPFGTPSSIVIVKTCCLGDVLFASAAVRAVDAAFPTARIGFVVGDHSRPAVVDNPRIDEIVDAPGLNGRFDRVAYAALARRLRAGRWDAAIVLERSALMTLLPWLAGIPVRAGIDSGGRGVGLTHRAPWVEGSHEADVYLDVVRAAGISTEDALPEYTPSAADTAWAASIEADRLAVIHPGGGVNPGMVLAAKRWPADRYAALADRLRDDGWTVAVVGADSERQIAEQILAAVPAIDLVGQTTFGQLGALAARAGLWVGNDSGPTHLAAAAGAPTIGIFGPSTPEMYAPRGQAARALYDPPPCSPCFLRGRFNEACKHWVCIEAVTVEAVLAAARELTGDSVGG